MNLSKVNTESDSLNSSFNITSLYPCLNINENSVVKF